MRKQRFLRVLLAMYAVAAVTLTVVLVLRGNALARCEEKPLTLEEAWTDAVLDDYEVDWIGFHTGDLLSQSTDPMFVWTLDETVRGLSFYIRTSQPVRDMELYYTTQSGQDYAVERRLTPTICEPQKGYYEFRFPQATYVHQLRLDPTSAAGSFMQFRAMTLNPVWSASQYYAPTAVQLLALAAAPLLCTLVLQEFFCIFQHCKKKSDFICVKRRKSDGTEDEIPF